jgi:hypothetical protein
MYNYEVLKLALRELIEENSLAEVKEALADVEAERVELEVCKT